MHGSRLVLLGVLAVGLGACARPAPVPPPPPVVSDPSGFLDDYALLQAGGEDDLRYVYRNPAADWRRYDRILLEPVTLWRSGRGSLDPVPERDLLRLAADFENALRARVGESFAIVDAPGPGVMRVRLAITEARASDPVLDVLTATREAASPHPAGDGPLDPETRRFIASASLEGEIRDAETNQLLAQGVDHRREPGSLAGVAETWAEVNRRLAFWVDRVCSRLEKRTGR